MLDKVEDKVLLDYIIVYILRIHRIHTYLYVYTLAFFPHIGITYIQSAYGVHMTHTQRISYTSICVSRLFYALVYVYFIEMITQPYLYTLAKKRIFSPCVYTLFALFDLFDLFAFSLFFFSFAP